MYTLEPAQIKDIDLCGKIIDEGRQFQRQQGFVQWTEDYPNTETVRLDVIENKGYVVKSGDVIAGYMCIDFSGESAYDNIDGKWSSNEKYAVVHRMAFSQQFRGIGLADIVFTLIEKFCLNRNVPYIRIDTDVLNKRMQHILEKNGFKQCGIIIFQGSGKLAYDKLIY